MNAVLPRSLMATRCFCCAARALHDNGDGWQRCDWCGARLNPRTGGDPRVYRHELDARLKPGRADLPALGACDWFVDAYTARIAATGRGLWFASEEPAFIPGHGDERPDGTLRTLPEKLPAEVSLVVLARAGDPRLASYLSRNASHFSETVVVLDGADTEPTVDVAGVRFVQRALGGNFGAQRDAAMANVSSDWAFHLDLDEAVTAVFVSRLSALTKAAEAAGLRAVGFPRRNLVDGVLSDCFPDIQYRLVARQTRFVGRVHERPDACENWPRTTISLMGAIDHHLDGDRVKARTHLYDTLGQHPDRRRDEADLLRPYHG